MPWSRWTRWLRRRSDNDFAAEVDAHIAMEVERLVRAGMPEDEARYAARRAFGNVTTQREHFHEHRAWSGLESLAQDARYALRGMGQRPAFTAIAVASLAIGIGANTTMFGAIDALLVRTPAHVRDADRIHRFYLVHPQPDGSAPVVSFQGYKTYLTLRDDVRGFESVGAYAAKTISSGRGSDARPIDAMLATSSVFTMLGVQPALGRFFAPSEDLDEENHVAVIGYDAWRGWFGGDPSVLGRTIDVAGAPYTIVGIAPDGFTGIDVDRVDLWLPIGAANRIQSPGMVSVNGGRGFWLEIMVKRRTSAAVVQTASEATAVYRNLWRDQPMYETTFGKSHVILGSVIAARGPAATEDAKVSVWVAGVSLLVLLIACANVANLLLLRGLTRSREIALRLSLGATRWRVTRQSLVEGALLAIAGAVCALVLARWSATAMQRFLLPRAVTASIIDPRLLAFTAVVALGTGMLASFIPAWVTARRDFGPLLGGGRAPGSPHRLAVQRALIGGQVALAMVLLVGAGLFVSSLRNVRGVDLGLDAERLLYVRLDGTLPGGKGQPASVSANATYQAMLERVRSVPGVEKATLSAGEPITSGWGISVRRRGGDPPAQGSAVPMGRAVGTDYFETMGTTLRRGRLFTAADHATGAKVAIVDELAAAKYWPNGDALDPCAYLNGEQTCTQIVGVVATTVQWEIIKMKAPVVYVTLASRPDHDVSMMEIRTTGDPTRLIPALRQAILTVSPDLPWVDIRSVGERLSPQLRPWRLGASMFTAFGVLALCLAAVGLYGLLSYIVAQRTHEIGVRKALGAPRAKVIGVVLRGALAMTLTGVAVGLAAALGAGRLVASQLYGVSPRDPMVLAVCVVMLVGVAIVACLAPARRATRVDPMVALRAE